MNQADPNDETEPDPNQAPETPQPPPTQSRQFDVSFKQIFERETRAALRLFSSEPLTGPVSIINTELSQVQTRQVDLLFKVEAEEPWIVHLEAQSTTDASLPARLTNYNASLHLHHEMAVRSSIILLRPEADHPKLSGRYIVHLPASIGGRETISLTYEVYRLWTMDVHDFLQGPIGLLPLAPLTNITLDQLTQTLDTIQQRLRALGNPVQERELLSLTNLMLGLRRDHFAAAYQQIARNRIMIDWRDSLTARMLIQEGILEGRQEGIQEGRQEGILEGRQEGILEGLAVVRAMLLDLGTRRFGAAEPETQALIENSEDLDALRRAAGTILDVESWQELLATLRRALDDPETA